MRLHRTARNGVHTRDGRWNVKRSAMRNDFRPIEDGATATHAKTISRAFYVQSSAREMAGATRWQRSIMKDSLYASLMIYALQSTAGISPSSKMIPSHVFMHTGQRMIQAIENNCPGDRATPARHPCSLGWCVQSFSGTRRNGRRAGFRCQWPLRPWGSTPPCAPVFCIPDIPVSVK